MNIKDLRDLLGLKQLDKMQMPTLHSRVIQEPSEIEIQRMMSDVKLGGLGRMDLKHEDWFCYRLMPSLMRYGTYPPPFEAKSANDSTFEVLEVN